MKHCISCILIFFLSLLILQAQSSEDARLANEYYQQSDFEKARALFDKLKNEKTLIPLIHSNYLDLLLSEGDFRSAEKYLHNVIKYFPENIQYKVSMAYLYFVQGDLDKKNKYLAELRKEYDRSPHQLNLLAQSLIAYQLYDDALNILKEARRSLGDPSAFSLDIAAIHRMKDDKKSMTEEYLSYASANPLNVSYVKNIFQNLLKEETDLEYLEQTLIKKIQNNPQNDLYPDLLIWVELQRKNFYGAFIQAKALDKRRGSSGDESMKIGQLAMDNGSWEDAVTIFNYVVNEFPESYNYPMARRFLIESRERQVKKQFPVDREAIRQLLGEYGDLIRELGNNPVSLEAKRNKALLHAFYLDELDSAIHLLQSIIDNRRSPHYLIYQSKLDLGDIYLLQGQPWESTLLYSQVEKANKDSPLGYDAKLKNAKLSYYTGNFTLAKSHLDILKLATTREISNDAIALSLLVSTNTAFDTTDQVMQEFANIELLIFQNKEQQSIQRLNRLHQTYPDHSLTDEIYWLLSSLYMEAGNFDVSIQYLDKIILEYPEDILADDALFRKANIFVDYLDQPAQAQEILTQFLISYPGSMYAAEARTLLRKLRGDVLN